MRRDKKPLSWRTALLVVVAAGAFWFLLVIALYIVGPSSPDDWIPLVKTGGTMAALAMVLAVAIMVRHYQIKR
jgi:uncharacterized BrkB/YihY/UPF0761 family membrane protein